MYALFILFNGELSTISDKEYKAFVYINSKTKKNDIYCSYNGSRK